MKSCFIEQHFYVKPACRLLLFPCSGRRKEASSDRLFFLWSSLFSQAGLNKSYIPSYASRFSCLSSAHFVHCLLQNAAKIRNRDKTMTAAAPAAAMRVQTPSIRSFNRYFGVVQRVKSSGMQWMPLNSCPFGHSHLNPPTVF